MSAESHPVLFARAVEHLIGAKVLLPGASTLWRLVGTTREHADERGWRLLAPAAPPPLLASGQQVRSRPREDAGKDLMWGVRASEMVAFEFTKGAAMARAATHPPSEVSSVHAKRPARSRGELVRLAIGAAAIVLVALFAVLNTQQVTIHWVFTTTLSPLIVAIVAWSLVGAIGGAALGHLRRKSAAHGKRR